MVRRWLVNQVRYRRRSQRLDDARELAESLRSAWSAAPRKETAELAGLRLRLAVELGNIHRDAGRFVDAYFQTVSGSHLKHAVFLSSMGAQQPDGTGPVQKEHMAEKVLSALKVPVTFLVGVLTNVWHLHGKCSANCFGHCLCRISTTESTWIVLRNLIRSAGGAFARRYHPPRVANQGIKPQGGRNSFRRRAAGPKCLAK